MTTQFASTVSTVRSRVSLAPRSKLRVLQVINQLGLGGAESGVLKLVAGLDNDFEHCVCAIRGIESQEMCARLGMHKLIIAGSAQGRQVLLRKLLRIMKSYRPHIVHSRNWGAIEAVAAAYLAGVPAIIHSEHGYELDMLQGLPFRQRLLRRGLYSLAHTVFAVTKELRDYHARQAWLPSNRIGVIYNGVDTQRFFPMPHMRRLIRDQFAIPPDAFVVGSVGRIVPIKHYPDLLKAAHILVKRQRDVYVLLAGDGPALTSLIRASEQIPELSRRIRFVGVSHRIPELLNAFDVFVSTSLSEGMSNTLLEAMSTGLPVIATQVGGNPELVTEANGFLFPPGDYESLAELICRLSDSTDDRRRLGDLGRQLAIRCFSLERMLQQYRDLYRQSFHGQ